MEAIAISHSLFLKKCGDKHSGVHLNICSGLDKQNDGTFRTKGIGRKRVKKYSFIYFPGNFAQLCDFIGKSAEVLGKNASHLDNVLATLDVQQHSLGVLGIL